MIPSPTPRRPRPASAKRALPGLLAILLPILALGAPASAAADAGAAAPYFREIAREAGAAVRHHPPIFDSRLEHIMPMLAAGAAGGAVGDFNNDGWMDLFVNDARLGKDSKLLRNDGGFRFTDVTREAGLMGLNVDNQVASMALFFDADGDGWQDLLVVRMGKSKLFLNKGDGTFEDVSDRAGFDRPVNALSAVAFDYNRDGYVDVYLGSYFPDTNMFDLTMERVLHDSWETSRNGGSNVFYRNEGGGRFVDATREVGLEDTGWTMALGHADLDGDGWQDLYVANDYGTDRMFLNTGRGGFREVTETAIGFDTKKGMNAEIADFDNDGDLDIYVTNVTQSFLHECNMLWQNQGDGTFTDVSTELNVCDTGWGWGGKFFDYDNDGYLDLYVANGFFAGDGDYLEVLLPALWNEGEDPSHPDAWPPIEGRGIAGLEENVLFTNVRGLTFVRERESGLEVASDSRAILVADFDNDGRLDLFVTNQNGESMLFENRVENGNHWLLLDLEGKPPGTDAIGARVIVEAGRLRMMREVNNGNGFGGASSMRLHFGLAQAPQVDRMEVRWPDGSVQVWTGVEPNGLLRIVQGRDRIERSPGAGAKPEAQAGEPAGGEAAAPEDGAAEPPENGRGEPEGPAAGQVETPDPAGPQVVALVASADPWAAVADAPAVPQEGGTARTSGRPLVEKPYFEEIAEQAGVDHRHHGPSVDERLRNMGPWFTALGAGGATGDYDNDGLEDLYVTDSLRGHPNVLYRNDGDMRFTDVSEAAGVAHLNDDNNFSTMALFFDCDNDGWQDLLVVRFGRSVLLRNQGDGTFQDISDRLGVPRFRNPAAAVAFDYDKDGDLDLYLGSYFQDVDLTNVSTTRLLHNSWETARNGGTNVMLRNGGQCNFEDVTEQTGLGDTGWTLAIGTGDLDKDGWIDLYVANDFGPDKVYRNLGDGTFEDVSLTAIGVDTKKGMNAEMGDYDNDGWLDIYVTNITEPFLHECNMLWRNNGDFTFTDVSEPTGTCDTDWGWAGKFLDYDNDGWLDLYVNNGFISAGEEDYIDILMPIILDSDVDLSDTRSWPPLGNRSFSGYQMNRLLSNTGRHSFIDVSEAEGVGARTDGRGAIVADFDKDGDLDIYVLNSNQKALLFRNQRGNEKNWIRLELEGVESNRDALGTRVTFFARGGLQYRETEAGNGFQGQSSRHVHVGFGKLETVDRVVVEWLSGKKQVFENVATRQSYRLREGGPLEALARAPAEAGRGSVAGEADAAHDGIAADGSAGNEAADTTTDGEVGP
jgi:hypothetical protein